MNALDLIRTIRETPFRPLVLEFTGGHREVVNHPDNIMVIGSSVHIAQYENSDSGDLAVPEWVKKYSLRHLVSVEPANPAEA